MNAARNGRAPTILTEIGARRLTKQIQTKLAEAWDLLGKAFEGRAWEPLGYDTWEAYCAAEFSDLRKVKLSVQARRELVKTWTLEYGASVRAIAAPMGLSAATIHADRDTLRNAGELDDEEGATVLSLDNKRRSTRGTRKRPAPEPEPEPFAAMSQSDWATLMVNEAGKRGLTYKELSQTADGWDHAQSSTAMSRAKKRRQIQPSGHFRDGCTVYVAL